MRLLVSLNQFSVGLALLSLLSVGAASAQSLAGADATLEKKIDTRSAAVGQTVTAKLNGSVKSAGGIDLPRGTELVGKVAAVQSSRNDGPATLSILFTTAKLKNGKEVPVKVTLLAAASSSDGEQTVLGPPPAQVSDAAEVHQTPGAIGKVSLESAVRSNDSGTFSRTNGNFRLDAGTYFQLGIAPAAAAGGTSAAE